MSQPRAIIVKRWVCGGIGCTRSYAKRDAIEGHMETCWKVPENRACLTCANFKMESCCWGRSDFCGCNGERDWTCRLGLPIEPGKPRVGCEKWVAA